MSVIDSIEIPVRATTRALGADLARGYSQMRGFVERVSTPVSVGLNLAPMENDANRAKELAKKTAEHISRDYLAARIAPALTAATGHAMLAKSAIDHTTGHAADAVIGVSQATLRSGLNAAKGTLKAGVKTLATLAKIPLIVSSIALNVGFGLAQALIFAKVKQLTGMSTIKLLLIYAGVRVGLAIAKRLLVAGVKTMGRIAVIPFKIALGALRAGLRAARAMVASTMRQIASVAVVPLRVGGAAAGIGLAGTALGGLVGVPAAIAGSVKAASDLNETVSKVGYTFGDSSQIVISGADEMADKFGVVKRAFLDGAAGIGLIGKAAGQSDAESAKLGVHMARLASDLSSFANLSFEDSLEKIRSGLVGEAEPLRAVGVLLSENAVKAKAAEMGFASVKGQLDEGSKVMARAAIITESLKTASGDLGRTSGELANRLREVWGRLQNLAASMGSYLLPAAKSLGATFSEMSAGLASMVALNSSVFEAWGKKIKAAADWIGVAYRNLDSVKKIAGLAFADMGKYLWESLKAAFTNATRLGKYFANVLGQSIERAIQNGLHNSLMGTRWDPGEYVQRVSFTPPKMVSAQYQANPEIASLLKGIGTAEGFRALALAAKGAKNQLLDFAGRGIKGLAARSSEIVSDKESRQNVRRDFENTARRFAEAGRAEMIRRKRPLDFQLNRDKGRLPAGANDVLGAVAAVAGGAMGGVGINLPANVAQAAAKGASVTTARETRRYQAPDRFAGLAEHGSLESYSAILSHVGGNAKKDKGLDRVAENTGRLVTFAQETASGINRLAANSGPLTIFSIS